MQKTYTKKSPFRGLRWKGSKAAVSEHLKAVAKSKPKTKKGKKAKKTKRNEVPTTRIGLRMQSKEEYQEYLDGKWWKSKREQKLRSCAYICEECGADDVPLQVHHLHYLTLGQERNCDLRALCRPCHEQQHPDKIPASKRIQAVGKPRKSLPSKKPHPPRCKCSCGNFRKPNKKVCGACLRKQTTTLPAEQ